MKIWVKSALLLTFAVSTGCASITTGNHQLLTVHTTGGESDADVVCTIQNKDNYLTVPAGSAGNVEKGSKALLITCTDEDKLVSGTATHESTYQAANLGNVLLGGGVGIIVDAATGAMWKYPESVVVPMTCSRGKTDVAQATEVSEVTEVDTGSDN
ncbi:MAG: hypothetical protein P8L39_04865 [Halioglobus sp.]|nr:hypothetical protein [Halioglobus sp.]